MATQQDFDAILIPTQPFRPLEIGKYIDRGKKKKLFKGEYINTVAHTVDDLYLYYIEQGQIKVCFEKENGESTPLYWRNAGNAFSAEYFGFASIGRYKARFVATKDTVVFGFTQRQLYEFAQEDPALFYEYVYVCHMTFAQMGHRISNTGFQTSTQRIVMWLQKLCTGREPESDGSFDIPCTMTLQQLSELLFVHITTCTKLFAALEAEGIVRRTRSHIRVLDLERLQDHSLEENPIAY